MSVERGRNAVILLHVLIPFLSWFVESNRTEWSGTQVVYLIGLKYRHSSLGCKSDRCTGTMPREWKARRREALGRKLRRSTVFQLQSKAEQICSVVSPASIVG